MPVPLSDAIKSYNKEHTVQEQRQEQLPVPRQEQPLVPRQEQIPVQRQEQIPVQRQEQRQEHPYDLRRDSGHQDHYPERGQGQRLENRPENHQSFRQSYAGYPNQRTYDAAETPGYPNLPKDFPGYPVPGRYSYSADSINNSDKQSVSSGRRTPPFAERLAASSAEGGFVSGSQSLVNTPPLVHTPPIAWRQHKATVPHEMTAAHEADKNPDVVDHDLLMAATKRIEAAAREHPGWSSVEATIHDRKMKAARDVPERFDRNAPTGNAHHEQHNVSYPMSRREAQLQYQARVQAQARQLTHYAPPENLLKLHELVAAKSAARAEAAGRTKGPGKSTSGPPPNAVARTGSTSWGGHYNSYSEKPVTGVSMSGNGARLDGWNNLDLRFLDDESAY
jgi:hypothetical protein